MPTTPVPELDWKRLGTFFKSRRKELDLDQTDVAKRVDIATNSVSRLERGNPASIETVAAVAAALDWRVVDAIALLSGERVEDSERREEPPTPDVVALVSDKIDYIKPSNPEKITRPVAVVQFHLGDNPTNTKDLEYTLIAMHTFADQLLTTFAARREQDPDDPRERALSQASSYRQDS